MISELRQEKLSVVYQAFSERLLSFLFQNKEQKVLKYANEVL